MLDEPDLAAFLAEYEQLLGFVARSRQHPERVCVDADTWKRSWLDTRARLAGKGPFRFYRNG